MTRRANREGTIGLRADGRWCARFYVDAPNGSKRKSVYGATRAEAYAKMIAALSEDRSGIDFDAERITFGDYLDRWLRDAVEGSLKERTYMTYEQNVRKHVKPSLGHIELRKLTPAHLQALYRVKLEEGLHPQSVLAIHTAVSGALRQAVLWQLIGRNPASGAKPPRPKKRETPSMSREDTARLLAGAKDHSHTIYTLLALALATGLRHGELLALRWEDVSLEALNRELRVRQSVGRGRAVRDGGPGYIYDTPKTGRGRPVSFGPRMAALLKDHRKRQLEEALGNGWERPRMLFTSETGGPLYQWKIGRVFKAVRDEAGIAAFRFHDLRHTYATRALEAGIHPSVVQQALGHSKVGTTLDTYSHVSPSLQREAAEKVEDSIF